MSAITNLADFALRKHESFHSKLKGFCSSPKQFDSNVEVNMAHITAEGIKKNNQRLALNKEDIAAVIQQGALNISRCIPAQANMPAEIAVEGKILDFKWIDYSKMESKSELLVQVRVVVRDRKTRSLVITAYVLDPPIDREMPEVNREIW